MKRKLAFFLALCMIFTQAIPAWAEAIKAGNIGAAALETTASPSDAEKASSSDAKTATSSDVLPGSLEDARIENVMYLDENGDEQTAECIMIRGNWDELSFTQGGWYAVDGDVTIAGRIWNRAPAGEAVHVILMDGCQWTVPKGINNGGGSILNFYGQKESDGRLCIEHCDSYCAGIGTRSVKDGVGTVTINGGDFLIRGGSNAAGIGGGNDCDCGTVTINGDVMELVDENRIAVKHGIEILKKTTNLGMKTLMEVTGVHKDVLSAYHIGFILGPCINASGRLDTAKRALELFSCLDKGQATVISKELYDLNESRKNMTRTLSSIYSS